MLNNCWKRENEEICFLRLEDESQSQILLLGLSGGGAVRRRLRLCDSDFAGTDRPAGSEGKAHGTTEYE